MISQGMVSKGDETQKGRVGGIVKKISSILNIAKYIPIIGQAC